MNEAKSEIKVEHRPTPARLDSLGVMHWPIWEKEASTFPWAYDAAETCYFLDGDVLVTPAHGAAVQIGTGDLVTFPAGTTCTWEIRRAVRKHYRLG